MEVDGSLKYFRLALVEMMAFATKKMDELEFQKFIDETLVEVDIPKRMAGLYSKYYTADDIMSLTAFFKTSTGKKVLKFQTKLLPKVNFQTQLIAAEMMVVALRKLASNNIIQPDPEDEVDEDGDTDGEEDGQDLT